jgi:hypothetical protein
MSRCSVFSIQYGVPLERSTFQFSTADFLYMLLFGMVALLVRSFAARQNTIPVTKFQHCRLSSTYRKPPSSLSASAGT